MRFVLPAGRHRVLARHGESSGFGDVEITPGTTQTLAIDLDAGKVNVSMTTEQQQTAFPFTWFSVYRVERDASGRTRWHRVFNGCYYASTDIVLPVGEYVASGRTDRYRRETAFTVEPGTVKSVEIIAAR